MTKKLEDQIKERAEKYADGIYTSDLQLKRDIATYTAGAKAFANEEAMEVLKNMVDVINAIDGEIDPKKLELLFDMADEASTILSKNNEQLKTD